MSSIWRISGELEISLFKVVCNLYDLSKSIRCSRIVLHITKILKTLWITLSRNLTFVDITSSHIFWLAQGFVQSTLPRHTKDVWTFNLVFGSQNKEKSFLIYFTLCRNIALFIEKSIYHNVYHNVYLNGYLRTKWNQRSEFKPWTRLLTFHFTYDFEKWHEFT